jgi:hypothetical protein
MEYGHGAPVAKGKVLQGELAVIAAEDRGPEG